MLDYRTDICKFLTIGFFPRCISKTNFSLSDVATVTREGEQWMRDRSIVPAYENKSKGTKFTYHINNQRGFIIVKSRIIKTKQAVFPWKLKMGKNITIILIFMHV